MPSQANGLLDLKGTMTILLFINAETTGPLFQYSANYWGVHLFYNTPNNFFGRLTKRSSLDILPSLASPIPLGEWKFVGFTYDALTGQNTLWIDGQAVKTYNVGIHEIATQFEIRLGAINFNHLHYRGKIACVQVYKKVLTGQQIEDARRLCRYIT